MRSHRTIKAYGRRLGVRAWYTMSFFAQTQTGGFVAVLQAPYAHKMWPLISCELLLIYLVYRILERQGNRTL